MSVAFYPSADLGVFTTFGDALSELGLSDREIEACTEPAKGEFGLIELPGYDATIRAVVYRHDADAWRLLYLVGDGCADYRDAESDSLALSRTVWSDPEAAAPAGWCVVVDRGGFLQ